MCLCWKCKLLHINMKSPPFNLFLAGAVIVPKIYNMFSFYRKIKKEIDVVIDLKIEKCKREQIKDICTPQCYFGFISRLWEAKPKLNIICWWLNDCCAFGGGEAIQVGRDWQIHRGIRIFKLHLNMDLNSLKKIQDHIL